MASRELGEEDSQVTGVPLRQQLRGERRGRAQGLESGLAQISVTLRRSHPFSWFPFLEDEVITASGLYCCEH